MHKFIKKLEEVLDNKWVMGIITVALFAHMLATPWMPTVYLAGFSSLAARIVISILVLCLVCVHPYYGILLTSVLVVALNEYNNRSAAFQNVSQTLPVSVDMSELDQIYMAPLHTPSQYDKNFKLVAESENISANADTVLAKEPTDVRLLINQHNMQNTSLTGGLHGMFNLSEDQKISAMMKTHPASNTLTQNVEHSYIGSTPYLTDKNLMDAQNNMVEGIDMNALVSNFPEAGKDILDAQALNVHFPRGADPAEGPSSKF